MTWGSHRPESSRRQAQFRLLTPDFSALTDHQPLPLGGPKVTRQKPEITEKKGALVRRMKPRDVRWKHQKKTAPKDVIETKGG